MPTEKTLLIGGVIAVGAIFALAALKRQRLNEQVYRNSPGLISQPGQAANYGASQLILQTTSGLGNFIRDQFSRSGDRNDPGLESNSATDFPGMDYNYENSNSYSVNYGAISDAPSSVDTSYPSDDDSEENDAGWGL